MKPPVKCDKDLLKLLLSSDASEIDFLVDVLTDNGAGRVALSSSIKDLLLIQKAEGAYTEDGLRNLLHELQEFGGHSIMNLFRSEPVPYEEILIDVHEKLNGIEGKTKDASQKEREIVLGLFGESWQTMPDHERLERCTAPMVLGGFFKMKDNLNLDRAGIASGLSAAASAAVFVGMRAAPPVAAVATLGLVSQSMSAAYRVSIPFVAQIARIKMLVEFQSMNKHASR